MKKLLKITALTEGLTGVTLLIAPALVVSLLLGVPLTEQSGILLGRVGGAALISLSVACWMASDDKNASVIMIKALTLYNLVAALLLIYAGAIEHSYGIALWPAAVLHFVLLAWCFQSLRRKR